ncbi:MAG: tetratricopeptide repeat protein [bacterium]|nr:tetratricopeptide repeat protein [bacterium]
MSYSAGLFRLMVVSIAILASSVLFPAMAAGENSFPLSPGSSWTYRDLDGKEEVLFIKGTTNRQGVLLVEASYTGRKPFYYVITAEGIGRLEPTSPPDSAELYGQLSFLINWPLEPGRTWNSPWSDPPLIFTVLERGPVTVAAGTFRNAIRIGYRSATDPIYLGYMWFAPGVGLLVQAESGSRVELVNYALTDLLPPPASGDGMRDLAVLFRPPQGASGGHVVARKGVASSARLTSVVGAGVLFMMVLAFAAYLRSVRVDVELESDSQVREGEVALASAMVREGLYGEAAEILQRLTARHPQWPDIAALLGSAYRESRQYEEACLELKRALTLNPDMAAARLELARTYLDLDDPVRAMEEVEAVLGAHGEFADAYYLKGEAFACMGQDEEALEAFRKALSINPSFEEAQEALELFLASRSGDQVLTP